LKLPIIASRSTETIGGAGVELYQPERPRCV